MDTKTLSSFVSVRRIRIGYCEKEIVYFSMLGNERWMSIR
jgi:hypothetical protein